MAIEFYSTKNAYGEFSNFAPFRIEVDTATWPTSEHYFQAQKFADAAYREQIRAEKSPMIAARLGRSREVPLRADWELVKDDVMLTALRAKFSQHESLRALLLSTGEEELIEATSNDYYWGCGTKRTGQNKLGVLLMQLRDELRAS